MKKYLLMLSVSSLAIYNLFSQTAPGQVSLAIGTNSSVTGQNTFASGLGAQATSPSQFYTATAIGYNCKATGNNSIAMGLLTNASAEQSIAIGNSSLSNGYSCFAFGSFTTASGSMSTAIGAYIGTGGKKGAFAIGDVPGNNTQTNNDADNQMMMRFAGGYKFLLNPTTQAFAINSNGTIGIDQSNHNNGTITGGLIFGGGSGEGIASKRTGGGNQYGLDFYSNFTNRMSITNAGKIGIGTSSPQQMFSVAGSMNIDQNNQNSGSYLQSALTFGSGSGEGIASNRAGGVNQYGLDLYAGGINRMCITNGGNVGIGITLPAAKLHVNGTIMATGTITPSDIRYKKDIHPINDALKKIMNLSGYSYSLRTDEFPEMSFETKKQIGVIAQEVEKVLPEVVVTLQSGYKTVDYPKLIPLLIQGMKEQQQQIEELKKLVAELIKNK
jgi:hypothetical protein